MQKKQRKKQLNFIQLFFLTVCIFSFFSMYTSYYVSTSSFSDTERITSTFIMGPAACVHGQGFWRHHPDHWPVETLSIGSVSYTKIEAITIMNTPGAGDKTYDLFCNLVATMLNLLDNCNPICIQETVTLADTWLRSHPVGSGVRANDPAWKLAKPWLKLFEQYNKGLLCEESCNTPPNPPHALPSDSPFQGSPPHLTVYVHDDDYDELTVRFYNAFNNSILGERTAVESDSNVSITLNQLPNNNSFSWYVIVTDQTAATTSPTWRFTINTNDSTSDNNETSQNTPSSPLDTFELIDLSPATTVSNTTYTFQVQTKNHSIIQEIIVQYWYNNTTHFNQTLSYYEGIWNTSIVILPNATRLWYQFSILDNTGTRSAEAEHDVTITPNRGTSE